MLKFSTKFINFFTSKYYSNVKYNHSFSFLLRIFFERATKVQSTVANLGNVYRNSKWSDLKIQNIKSLHLSSFLIISSLLIFLLFTIFIVLFRLDTTLFSSSLSVLFWPFVYVVDLVSYLWLSVSLIVYAVSNRVQIYLSSYFYNNVSSNIHLATQSDLNNKFTALNSLSESLAKSNISGDWVELLHSLYQSKLATHRLDSRKPKISTNSTANYLSVFLTTSNPSYLNKLSSDYTHTSSASITNKLSNLLDSEIFSTPLNLSKVNTSSVVLGSAYSHATSQNLNLANQTRWALRMSPISEKLARDNFNYTQAKGLLGSPIVNSHSSSNNIWSSSNLINLKDTSKFFASPNTTNLNHFEDSRSWAMKKLYFGLSVDSYSLYFSSAASDNVVEVSVNSDGNSLFSAYMLDYNLAYTNISLSSIGARSISSRKLPNLNLVGSDNTVYQDSYNNYILSLASTNVSSNFNSFRHSSAPTKTFIAALR